MTGTVAITDAELRRAVGDPRYRDAGHPERAGYVKWVTEGYQALHGPRANGGVVHVRAYERTRNGHAEHVGAHTRSHQGAEDGGSDASAAANPSASPQATHTPAPSTLRSRIGEGFDAVGQAVASVFTPQAILDQMMAAFQGVEPVLVEQGIASGALRPVADLERPSDYDPRPGEVEGGTFGWQGKLYPRLYTDPGTGEAVDVSTPDTVSGSLSRLGRYLGAGLYGNASVAAGVGTARLTRLAGNAAEDSAAILASGLPDAIRRTMPNLPRAGEAVTLGDQVFRTLENGSTEFGQLVEGVGRQVGPIRLPSGSAVHGAMHLEQPVRSAELATAGSRVQKPSWASWPPTTMRFGKRRAVGYF